MINKPFVCFYFLFFVVIYVFFLFHVFLHLFHASLLTLFLPNVYGMRLGSRYFGEQSKAKQSDKAIKEANQSKRERKKKMKVIEDEEKGKEKDEQSNKRSSIISPTLDFSEFLVSYPD
jgi:hypothetical protein